MRSSRRQANKSELVKEILTRLRPMAGISLSVSFQPELTVHNGKLLSGSPQKGSPVYAASFVRKRKIVLTTDLLTDPPMLRLILVHEVFHFIWPRLSNAIRKEFGELLRAELEGHARGALGESSGVKKQVWSRSAAAWKDYACESFCDTAAWLFAGVRRHQSFRLAKVWRTRRAFWFHNTFERYWRVRCS
jgi:hypothetical protein